MDACLEQAGKWVCNGIPEEPEGPQLNLSAPIESGEVSAEESTCGMSALFLLLPLYLMKKISSPPK